MLTTRPVRLAWALLTPPTPARPRTSAPSTWFSSNGTALRRVGATRVSEQDLEDPHRRRDPSTRSLFTALRAACLRLLHALGSFCRSLFQRFREKTKLGKLPRGFNGTLELFLVDSLRNRIPKDFQKSFLHPPSILQQKKKVRSASQREAKKTEAPPRGERRREGERERSEATRGLIEDGDSVHRLTHLAHLKE